MYIIQQLMAYRNWLQGLMPDLMLRLRVYIIWMSCILHMAAWLQMKLKLEVNRQAVIMNATPVTPDPAVTEELTRLGIEPAASIPWDEEVYQYDLKLKPLIELPDTSKAVGAVNELMAKLLTEIQVNLVR